MTSGGPGCPAALASPAAKGSAGWHSLGGRHSPEVTLSTPAF